MDTNTSTQSPAGQSPALAVDAWLGLLGNYATAADVEAEKKHFDESTPLEIVTISATPWIGVSASGRFGTGDGPLAPATETVTACYPTQRLLRRNRCIVMSVTKKLQFPINSHR